MNEKELVIYGIEEIKRGFSLESLTSHFINDLGVKKPIALKLIDKISKQI